MRVRSYPLPDDLVGKDIDVALELLWPIMLATNDRGKCEVSIREAFQVATIPFLEGRIVSSDGEWFVFAHDPDGHGTVHVSLRCEDVRSIHHIPRVRPVIPEEDEGVA